MHRKNSLFLSEVALIIFLITVYFSCTTTMTGSPETPSGLSLEHWRYIEVDSQRAKHGDWDKPRWLKYFGLDMMDVTGDDFKDIVAGRYSYRNPGGESRPHFKVETRAATYYYDIGGGGLSLGYKLILP